MSVLRYDQHVVECTEHEDCTVLVGEGANEVGEFRTESHMSSSIDPAFRLNFDYPDAADRRVGAAKDARVQWRLADDDAVAHEDFPWDAKDRRRVAAVAAAKGLGLVTDLAVAAKTDAADLIAEATAARWIDASDKAVLDEQVATGEIALPADQVPVNPKGGIRG